MSEQKNWVTTWLIPTREEIVADALAKLRSDLKRIFAGQEPHP